MARQFDDAASEYLEIDSTPVTALPISLSIRFLQDDSGNDSNVITLADKDVGDVYTRLNTFLSGGNRINDFHARNGGSLAHAVSGGNFSINVWNCATGAYRASNDRDSYLNGTDVGNNSATVTAGAWDRLSIARTGDSTPGAYHSGALCEAGVYKSDLSEDEALAHTDGWSLLNIRLEDLAAYYPLGGLFGENDVDFIAAANMTAFNTPTRVDHPDVIYPCDPMQVHAPAPAVAAGNPWYYYANQN